MRAVDGLNKSGFLKFALWLKSQHVKTGKRDILNGMSVPLLKNIEGFEASLIMTLQSNYWAVKNCKLNRHYLLFHLVSFYFC